MKNPPSITDTEWQIMQVLWANPSLSAGEICQVLQKDDPSWHPKTAHTLITRLVKKGAVGFVSRGRTYFYHALFTAKECADQASKSFLDRVFGGSLQPMLAHFVENRKLSTKDIQELKKILEGKK